MGKACNGEDTQKGATSFKIRVYEAMRSRITYFYTLPLSTDATKRRDSPAGTWYGGGMANHLTRFGSTQG